jgi:hypothetical protein
MFASLIDFFVFYLFYQLLTTDQRAANQTEHGKSNQGRGT